MRFAVTGGAGFIGNHLVRLLVSNGHDVTVVDNLARGDMANLDDVLDEIRFESADIRDSERLDAVLNDVDGIFHQAALGFVPESWNNPDQYRSVNVDGTRSVFQVARRRDIKVVYASSSSVYGDVQSIPIREDAERRPMSPYARTKLDCEILAEEYIRKGTRVIGLRYFNVFGMGENPEYARVIPKFLARVGRGEPPVIFGDGSHVKDFTFVRDVAEANLLAMSRDAKPGFINIGGGRPVTLGDLARLIISLAGLDIKPVYDKPRRGDPKMSAADITKAARVLGWRPRTSLEEGLRTMIGAGKG